MDQAKLARMQASVRIGMLSAVILELGAVEKTFHLKLGEQLKG